MVLIGSSTTCTFRVPVVVSGYIRLVGTAKNPSPETAFWLLESSE